jgi:hypothetical protein
VSDVARGVKTWSSQGGLSIEAQTRPPSNIEKKDLKYHISKSDYDCILCHKHVKQGQYHIHEPLKFKRIRKN